MLGTLTYFHFFTRSTLPPAVAPQTPRPVAKDGPLPPPPPSLTLTMPGLSRIMPGPSQTVPPLCPVRCLAPCGVLSRCLPPSGLQSRIQLSMLQVSSLSLFFRSAPSPFSSVTLSLFFRSAPSPFRSAPSLSSLSLFCRSAPSPCSLVSSLSHGCSNKLLSLSMLL